MKRIPRLLTRKAKIISKRMPDIIARALFAKPVEELGVVLRKVDPGELRYPVKDSDIQVINRFEGNRHVNVESIYMPKESDLRTGFMVFHVRHTFFGEAAGVPVALQREGFLGITCAALGNDEKLRIVIHDVIPIERGKDGKTRRPGRLKRWWHRRKRNSSVSINPEAMDDAVDNVFEEVLEFLLGLIFGG